MKVGGRSAVGAATARPAAPSGATISNGPIPGYPCPSPKPRPADKRLILWLWSGDNRGPMISALLHLLRLLPFLCGGSRELALEDLALRQQLAVYKRTTNRPKLRPPGSIVPRLACRAQRATRRTVPRFPPSADSHVHRSVAALMIWLSRRILSVASAAIVATGARRDSGEGQPRKHASEI